MIAQNGNGGDLRKGESAKILPIVFIVCNIVGLWGIYMWFHCIPLLQTTEGHKKGLVQTLIFNALTFMLVICYILCIVVHPGTIPERDEDPSWEYIPQDGQSPEALDGEVQETKKSGERRYCKWCTKYKPDRCHHCRVCRQCILRMDHHCPWIYNCVGFRNHKYFFLLLLYSAGTCHYMAWTMLDSVLKAVDEPTAFPSMFCLLFGETLAAFIGLLVTSFFFFHIWLMFQAMTTIEFCEKNTRGAKGSKGADADKGPKGSGGRSAYDRGLGGNIRAVLGDNPLFWLLPLSPPSGSGLRFLDEDTPFSRDFENGRGKSTSVAARRKGRDAVMQQKQSRDRRREQAMPPTGGTGGAGDEDAKESGSLAGRAYDYSSGYGATNDDSYGYCDVPVDKARRSRLRDDRRRGFAVC